MESTIYPEIGWMKEKFQILRLDNETCEFEWTMQPKGRIPEHLHKDCDEYFKVLAGEPNIKINDNTIVVKAGEEVNVPKMSRHSISNNSKELVKCNVKFIPAADQGKFFQILLFLNSIKPSDAMAPLKAMYISDQMKYKEFSSLQGGVKMVMKVMMGLFTLLAPITGWKKLFLQYKNQLK